LGIRQETPALILRRPGRAVSKDGPDGSGVSWNILRDASLRPAPQDEGSKPRHTSSIHIGRIVAPISSLSMACAAWRPSRIAQTTSDWPRRMSPATKTLPTLVL